MPVFHTERRLSSSTSKPHTNSREDENGIYRLEIDPKD